MTTLPIPPERFRPYLRLIIGAVALVAGVALLGRAFGFVYPMRLVSGYPTMYPNTALGCVAGAIALYGIDAGRRSLAFGAAALVTLLAAATLVQYLADVDLGIDRLLFEPVSTSDTVLYPGRMSAALALSLMMIGTAVLELTVRKPHPGARQVAGVLGSIAGTLALTILFSYVTDVLGTLRFGYVTSMSIPGGVCIVLLGLALVLIAWHHQSSLSPFPTWVPLGAGASVLVATLLISGGLSITERERAMAQVAEQARAVHHHVTEQIESALRPVRQLGELAVTGTPSDSIATRWSTAADRARRTTPGLLAVEWVDSLYTPVLQPTSPHWASFNRLTLGEMLSAWSPDERRRREAKFVAVSLSEFGQYVLVAVPTCPSEVCQGYTVALFQPDRLLAPVLSNAVPGYSFEVLARLRTMYASPGPSRALELTARADTVADGQHWVVRAWPHEATVDVLISDLPEVMAGLGFLVSALLTSTLHLVQRSIVTARRAERERIATALEGNTEGIWEVSLTTGEGMRSPGIWRQVGIDPATVSATDTVTLWESMIHPGDREAVRQATVDHLEGRTDAIEVSYRVEGKSGQHWIVDRGRVVERDARNAPARLLGTVSDITEKKQAEDLLATSERRFRAVFNSGFQFETLLDLDCRLIESNRTSLDFAGVDLDAVRGKPFWETAWWAHSPEAQARLRSACDEARTGRTVQYQDEVCGAGDRRAFIDFSLKPILDADGRVAQLLAEGRDITETKRAEDSVREMDTLGTIGRLAARVAHEINNPLAGIQNSFLLIKDAVPASHPYYSYVGAIEREIARIAAVTRQLYETFRPESDGTADSSVAVVISDAVTMLKQVNRAAQVVIEVDTSRAPPILAIPSPLLRQAVYNLVQNAVEASPAGGTVRVEAWQDEGEFWLRVRDEGPGVATDMREKIFEPFVTTKGSIATGGMGLGLSLVRRAVQAMGGRIEVDDAPGGGAEFRLRLPIK